MKITLRVGADEMTTSIHEYVTAAFLRSQYQTIMRISPKMVAFVDGMVVSESYFLSDGDVVNFALPNTQQDKIKRIKVLLKEMNEVLSTM